MTSTIKFNVPDEFYCPITGNLMENPYSEPITGHTYEKKAIEDWLVLHNKKTSPLTRNPLKFEDLKPNLALKKSIESIKNQLTKEQLSIKSKLFQEQNQTHFNLLSQIKPECSYFNNNLVIKLNIPEQEERAPVDIALLIDTSGSMGAEATLKGAKGENIVNGISVLSLTIQAAKTVLRSLNDDDNITIVTFDTKAEIIYSNKPCTQQNKVEIESNLDKLKCAGTTNLWDGIKTTLNIMRENQIPNKLKVIKLLTDGLPSEHQLPVQGIEYELKNYFKKYNFNCMINCYGFGYSLKSDLLQDISSITGGDGFTYIPDSSLLGNAFIHGTANFLNSINTQAEININLLNNIKFNDKYNTTEKYISCQSMKFGQNKTFLFEIKDDKIPEDSKICDIYIKINNNEFKFEINKNTINDTENFYKQFFRIKAVDCLKVCLQLMKFNDKEKTKIEINNFLNEITKYDTNEYISNIIYDFNGQVKEALNMTLDGEKQNWFGKWGMHYLRSLSDAYSNEICNNFKDKGVSNFTCEYFDKLRTEISDTFDNLPPPKRNAYNSSGFQFPSSTITYGSSASVTPVDMRMYNNSGGGCCAEGCRIKMIDGTFKKVEDCKKGDEIITVNLHSNKIKYEKSKIECIVMTDCNYGVEEMVTLGNLKITNYHPIIEEKLISENKIKWNFPCNINNSETIYCNKMFTFVIENRQPVIIENHIFATYGNNFKEENKVKVIEHDYFGTEKVIIDLKCFNNYKNGYINLNKNMFIRNKKGLVTKISPNLKCIDVVKSLYMASI